MDKWGRGDERYTHGEEEDKHYSDQWRSERGAGFPEVCNDFEYEYRYGDKYKDKRWLDYGTPPPRDQYGKWVASREPMFQEDKWNAFINGGDNSTGATNSQLSKWDPEPMLDSKVSYGHLITNYSQHDRSRSRSRNRRHGQHRYKEDSRSTSSERRGKRKHSKCSRSRSTYSRSRSKSPLRRKRHSYNTSDDFGKYSSASKRTTRRSRSRSRLKSGRSYHHKHSSHQYSSDSRSRSRSPTGKGHAANDSIHRRRKYRSKSPHGRIAHHRIAVKSRSRSRSRSPNGKGNATNDSIHRGCKYRSKSPHGRSAHHRIAVKSRSRSRSRSPNGKGNATNDSMHRGRKYRSKSPHGRSAHHRIAVKSRSRSRSHCGKSARNYEQRPHNSAGGKRYSRSRSPRTISPNGKTGQTGRNHGHSAQNRAGIKSRSRSRSHCGKSARNYEQRPHNGADGKRYSRSRSPRSRSPDGKSGRNHGHSAQNRAGMNSRSRSRSPAGKRVRNHAEERHEDNFSCTENNRSHNRDYRSRSPVLIRKGEVHKEHKTTVASSSETQTTVHHDHPHGSNSTVVSGTADSDTKGHVSRAPPQRKGSNKNVLTNSSITISHGENLIDTFQLKRHTSHDTISTDVTDKTDGNISGIITLPDSFEEQRSVMSSPEATTDTDFENKWSPKNSPIKGKQVSVVISSSTCSDSDSESESSASDGEYGPNATVANIGKRKTSLQLLYDESRSEMGHDTELPNIRAAQKRGTANRRKTVTVRKKCKAAASKPSVSDSNRHDETGDTEEDTSMRGTCKLNESVKISQKQKKQSKSSAKGITKTEGEVSNREVSTVSVSKQPTSNPIGRKASKRNQETEGHRVNDANKAQKSDMTSAVPNKSELAGKKSSKNKRQKDSCTDKTGTSVGEKMIPTQGLKSSAKNSKKVSKKDGQGDDCVESVTKSSDTINVTPTQGKSSAKKSSKSDGQKVSKKDGQGNDDVENVTKISDKINVTPTQGKSTAKKSSKSDGQKVFKKNGQDDDDVGSVPKSSDEINVTPTQGKKSSKRGKQQVSKKDGQGNDNVESVTKSSAEINVISTRGKNKSTATKSSKSDGKDQVEINVTNTKAKGSKSSAKKLGTGTSNKNSSCSLASNTCEKNRRPASTDQMTPKRTSSTKRSSSASKCSTTSEESLSATKSKRLKVDTTPSRRSPRVIVKSEPDNCNTSISDMLAQLNPGMMTICIPVDDYEFYVNSKNFAVDGDAKPPTIQLIEGSRDSKRYIIPKTHKNMKYTNDDLMVLKGEARTKCLNALRQRNRRKHIAEKYSESYRLQAYRANIRDEDKVEHIRTQTRLSSLSSGKSDSLQPNPASAPSSVMNTDSSSSAKASEKKGVQAYRERQRAVMLSTERKRQSRKRLSARRTLINTDLDQFTTPKKYRPQIRQRACDYKKKLPRSPSMKVALLGRMIGQLLRDPKTQNSMRGCLKRVSEIKRTEDQSMLTKKDEESRNQLQLAVLKICGYRAVKHVTKLNDAVHKLKSNYTIRSAAKKLNISYSKLHRMLSVPSKSIRRVTTREKGRVGDMYRSNAISLQLPYKKFAKNHYLRTTLEVAYEAYVQEQLRLGFRVLSRSAVYRCIPKSVKIRRKIPMKGCECDICLNNSLLVDALLAVDVKGISRRITQNLLNSYCPIEKKDNTELVITDFRRECIFRDCVECGVKSLEISILTHTDNNGRDWSNEVVYHQWKSVKINAPGKPAKSRIDKVRFKCSVQELVSLLCTSVGILSAHFFHFRWQNMQYEECKKQLQEGDVLMCMDFSQNWDHVPQNEVQSGYFSRAQSTLHPIVAYYICPEECSNLICDEIMVVSDDKKHDSHAVNAFVSVALDHLSKKGVALKRLIQFSDNCASQYKCCRVFDNISKCQIPMLRNYFGAKHGKGEADGAIGRLSMQIDAVVRSGIHEINNSKAMVQYCTAFLTKDVVPGTCGHYQRHFYFVPSADIKRDEQTDADTLEGTLGIHSVRNTAVTGFVEVRQSSCFCEVCFLNEDGSCKNSNLVNDFARANIYKRLQKKEGEFVNTLWKSKTIKYESRKSRNVTRRHLGRQKRKQINTQPLPKPVLLPESSDDSDFESTLPLIEIMKASKKNRKPRTRHGKVTEVGKTSVTCFESKPIYVSDFETDDWSHEDTVPLSTLRVKRKKHDKEYHHRQSLFLKAGENSFWDNMYDKLMASKTFDALKDLVQSLTIPTLPDVFAGDGERLGDKRDLSAQGFIPSDCPSLFQLHSPVTIYGDGNCFPRTLSRLVYGHQRYHKEMRCRVIIDSVQNFANYVNHDYLMRGATHNHKRISHIGTQYCTYSPAEQGDTETQNGIERTFAAEIMSVRKSGTYCSIWQIQSGANVLERKIVVLFPTGYGMRGMRNDMQRTFYPGTNNIPRDPCVIMWTYFSANSQKPDHLVPLIQWSCPRVRLVVGGKSTNPENNSDEGVKVASALKRKMVTKHRGHGNRSDKANGAVTKSDRVSAHTSQSSDSPTQMRDPVPKSTSLSMATELAQNIAHHYPQAFSAITVPGGVTAEFSDTEDTGLGSDLNTSAEVVNLIQSIDMRPEESRLRQGAWNATIANLSEDSNIVISDIASKETDKIVQQVESDDEPLTKYNVPKSTACATMDHGNPSPAEKASPTEKETDKIVQQVESDDEPLSKYNMPNSTACATMDSSPADKASPTEKTDHVPNSHVDDMSKHQHHPESGNSVTKGELSNSAEADNVTKEEPSNSAEADNVTNGKPSNSAEADNVNKEENPSEEGNAVTKEKTSDYAEAANVTNGKLSNSAQADNVAKEALSNSTEQDNMTVTEKKCRSENGNSVANVKESEVGSSVTKEPFDSPEVDNVTKEEHSSEFEDISITSKELGSEEGDNVTNEEQLDSAGKVDSVTTEAGVDSAAGDSVTDEEDLASEEEDAMSLDEIMTVLSCNASESDKPSDTSGDEQLRYVPESYKSARDLGFLLHKVANDYLMRLVQQQSWQLVQVVSGLKEGFGVMAKVSIKPQVIVCNYGGQLLSQEVAEKKLFPYPELCTFLLQFSEQKFGKPWTCFANHDKSTTNTVGKYLNHSRRHPNLKAKVFFYPNGMPDVFFITKHFVKQGTQLTWDYGRSYDGVSNCVDNCVKCKSRKSRI